ncbi:hypothetical protein L2E82_08281 [Cichorium intybus]|uniref:Uncharacterized protein n=1 Tax=Cichorium intybus TaxID=13427 RepID=A0ACB9G638_CICIN|nr:hypothetical protein L2E82_08281 [Cichorium intybus]
MKLGESNQFVSHSLVVFLTTSLPSTFQNAITFAYCWGVQRSDIPLPEPMKVVQKALPSDDGGGCLVPPCCFPTCTAFRQGSDDTFNSAFHQASNNTHLQHRLPSALPSAALLLRQRCK